MKLSPKIDIFWKAHPKLFLAAVLILTVVVVLIVRVTGATGSRVVYQAF